MPAHKLILLPADPYASINHSGELAACLQANGLIGAPIAYNDSVFYPTGENFLQLISFLGCSPMVELEPPADAALLETACANGTFCHVVLACTDTLQFRADAQPRPPRCPHCKQPVADWKRIIDLWRINPTLLEWLCAACGYHSKLTALHFRKTAGFGKVFVEIRGIYPSEAVPGAALLTTLQLQTGGRWRYMYIKE